MLFKNSLGLAAICCMLVCCGKKKAEEPAPEAQLPVIINPPSQVKYGKAVIHLHTFVGDEELEGYEDDVFLGERRISMSLGSVYLSDMEMVSMDGSIGKISDTVILKTAENINYNLSGIPVGKYKSFRFKVGLDSKSRLKSPTKSLGGILNKPEMWFGSIQDPESYLHVHFKGKIDTANIPNSGNVRVPYEFKIGTDSNFVQVQLPVRSPGTEFNINDKTPEYFHMYIDLSLLFKDIKFHETNGLSLLTKEDNNSVTAKKLAANIKNMFRYE